MDRDSDNRAPTSGNAATARPADIFAEADVFAQPRSRLNDLASPDPLDPIKIMTSIGEAPYRWSIDSDQIAWGANAADVLQTRVMSEISTGRGYDNCAKIENAARRFDAIVASPDRDGGAGVLYQLRYRFQPAGSETALRIEDTGRWFAGADGKPARAQGVVRVIDGGRGSGRQAVNAPLLDELTGEMNRIALVEMLGDVLNQAVSQRTSCGFLIIAIDNIARINEDYGREAADEAIDALAKRLRTKMRGGDQLGRFSGNKFGVVLNNCTPEDIERAAERLIAGARDDVVRTKAGPIAVILTIGGITAPRHASSVEQMLERAQEALDCARIRRAGSSQIYQPNSERDARRRENVRAADEIVTSLNERRVLLAFEPVVEARSRRPASYECLVRIRRNDGAIVPAKSIIPIAERLGLVHLIDHRVLEMLLGEMTAVEGLRASVNISQASIADPEAWSTFGAMLQAQPGIGARLTIEIAETVMNRDLDESKNFIGYMKDLGCRIAVDDLGSGCTSFRNLRNLGVDILKFDGAIVQNLSRSNEDHALIETLIGLASRHGLTTVAKWVQDEAAADMLAEWGCDQLQGALFGLASIERPWGQAVPADRRKATRL